MNAISAQPAAASTASSAGRADDRRWEFMFQNGRSPSKPEDQAGFTRYLCRQLEAATINTMLQAARSSAPKDGLLSGGFAGSMFQGLADEEYSRMLAARGGFGLGDKLYAQMAAARGLKAYAQAASPSNGAGNGAQEAAGNSDV